jgi:tetratricopeptide (TPR) repeat protein
MTRLPHPDALRLRSAIGWLELGNPAEALAELDEIDAASRAHPAVLKARGQVYQTLKKWTQALEIGRALTEMLPQDPESWTFFANSLYFSGATAAAYAVTKEVLPRFVTAWPLYYNLACYAAQLGKLDEARGYLDWATEIGDKREIEAMARKDPDLKPLWESDESAG